MTFTEKLDMLMQEKGLNKATLSKESGIPYTTIAGFYAKGTDNVKLSTLKRLCAYLGCSMDYLGDDDVLEEPKADLIADHSFLVELERRGFTQEQAARIESYANFIKEQEK